MTVSEPPEERAKALPIATTTTPAEAAALVAALESASIPALVQNTPQHVYGMGFQLHGADSLHKTILVPADRVLEAERVVNAFLLVVKREGIKRAFLPEEIEDLANNPRPEPEMVAARKLKKAPEEERDERLSAHLASWLVDGTGEVQVAQRLAAAGLTEAQATELVARVVRERADLFERARSKQVLIGACMMLGGAVWLSIFFLVILWDACNRGTGVTGLGRGTQEMVGHLVPAIALLGLGTLIWSRARPSKNPAIAEAFSVHAETQEEKPS